jgi:co-chaperonin GroES (HSP10)
MVNSNATKIKVLDAEAVVYFDYQPVKLTVSKGDKIAFNKTMAVELRLEDKVYLLIREENILCIVK